VLLAVVGEALTLSLVFLCRLKYDPDKETRKVLNRSPGKL